MSTAIEQRINQAHKDRYYAAAAECGGDIHAIPKEVREQLNEQLRQDWLDFYNGVRVEDHSPKKRKDKSARLAAFVKANPGLQVTPQDLVKQTEAAIGTVYAWMSDNRSLFRKLGAGTYLIVDEGAERAAAKVKPRPTSDSDAALANRALAALTGSEQEHE